MNCTPKVGQKKLTFEVFLYELSHEDKVKIHEMRKSGVILI